MGETPEGREALLVAKFDIEQIMRNRGMVGHFIIALPGQTECALVLGAPWCVAHMEHVDEHHAALRVRAVRADYEGREAERWEHITATAGAMHMMGEVLARQALVLIEAAKALEDVVQFGPMEYVKKQ